MKIHQRRRCNMIFLWKFNYLNDQFPSNCEQQFMWVLLDVGQHWLTHFLLFGNNNLCGYLWAIAYSFLQMLFLFWTFVSLVILYLWSVNASEVPVVRSHWEKLTVTKLHWKLVSHCTAKTSNVPWFLFWQWFWQKMSLYLAEALCQLKRRNLQPWTNSRSRKRLRKISS